MNRSSSGKKERKGIRETYNSRTAKKFNMT